MRWPWQRRGDEDLAELPRFEPSTNINVHHIRPEDITVTQMMLGGHAIDIGGQVTVFIDRDAGRNDTGEMVKRIGAELADPSTWKTRS